MPSLLETVNHLLRQGDNPDKLGALLGIDADRASVLVDLATPVLITGLADRAFEPGGSDVVVRLLDGIDPSIVDNPLIFVERGDATIGEGLLLSIFAGGHVGLRAALAERGEVPEAVVARLMPGILALAIGVLGRRRAVSGVDEAGVLELLATEKSVLPADQVSSSGGAGDHAVGGRVPVMAAIATSADTPAVEDSSVGARAADTVSTSGATTESAGADPNPAAHDDRTERRSTPAPVGDSGSIEGGPPEGSTDREGRGPLVLVVAGLVAVVLLAWTLSRLGGDGTSAAVDTGSDDVADTTDQPADQPADDDSDDETAETADSGDGETDTETSADETADDDDTATSTTEPPGESVEPVEPVTINEELSLDPVTFEVRSATITAEGLAVLDEAAEYLQASPEVTVEIAGHTDSDGETADNLTLSQDRADVVKDYLESLGIDGARMTAIGYGEDDPIASNDTEAGKAQNRRIEFVIQ